MCFFLLFVIFSSLYLFFSLLPSTHPYPLLYSSSASIPIPYSSAHTGQTLLSYPPRPPLPPSQVHLHFPGTLQSRKHFFTSHY
jgi:hypothetical protein